MHDDENTAPISVPGVTSDDTVVVTVEILEYGGGSPAMVELHVFRDPTLAELHALHRHDVEMLGEQSLYLDAIERGAARTRWLTRLRSGAPMKLGIDRTIRLRPQKVRKSA